MCLAIPMKVIEYLNGKSAFSFIYELQNEGEEAHKKYLGNVKFWYPSWWNISTISSIESKDKAVHAQLIDLLTSNKVHNSNLKPEKAVMELSNRRLVTFAIAAWKQDENAWDNLFAVRGEKTGTQSITKIVVDNIKTLINE